MEVSCYITAARTPVCRAYRRSTSPSDISDETPALPPKLPSAEAAIPIKLQSSSSSTAPIPPRSPLPQHLGPPTPAPTPPPAQESQARQFAIGCNFLLKC